MSAQKKGETAVAWYQRLVQEREAMDVNFRLAKAAASQEINERSAVLKLSRNQSLQPSEVRAYSAMLPARREALLKEIAQ